MNDSVIVSSVDPGSNTHELGNNLFLFDKPFVSNPGQIKDLINIAINNKSINTFTILLPSHINNLFWDFLKLSNFLYSLGLNVEVITPEGFTTSINDFVNKTKKNVGQSTKKYFQEPASLGKVLGRTPFGYLKNEHGDFGIVGHEGDIVQQIFSLYVNENYGLRKIASFLNSKNIKTRKGNTWNIASLRLILTNSIYMGTYKRYRFTKFSNHQPIIASSIFRKAQDILSSRTPLRKLPKKDFFLLSGLAKCGYCKNSYVGVQKHQYWKTQTSRLNKGSYKYYKCLSNLNNNICMTESRRADTFETEVVKRIILLLTTKDNIISTIFYNLFLNQFDVENIKIQLLKTKDTIDYQIDNTTLINTLITADLYNQRSFKNFIPQIINSWKSGSLLTYIYRIFTEEWTELDPVLKKITIELCTKSINVYQNRLRIII